MIDLWRVYVPAWGWKPLSGEGARRYGGRWNPVGMPALYAARELTTAWSEYNQGLVQHPGLVVRLRLSGARLVDAGDPAIATAFAIPADFGGDHWRDDAARDGTAATQRAGGAMAAAGHDGLSYPSAMSLGGNAVVLWRWTPRHWRSRTPKVGSPKMPRHGAEPQSMTSRRDRTGCQGVTLAAGGA